MALRLVTVLTFWILSSIPAYTATFDGGATVGNGVTVGTVANALQSAGYQAQVVNAPSWAAGAITTGTSGIKVILYLIKCSTTKTNVCYVSFNIVFLDDKNILNDHAIKLLNEKLYFAKARVIFTKDGKNDMLLSYNYFCKDGDPTKFVPQILQLLPGDAAIAARLYKAGFPDGPNSSVTAPPLPPSPPNAAR